MKRIALFIIAVASLAGCQQEQPMAPPPPKLPVVHITQKDVEIDKEFVGQVYGKVDIPIRARVEGFLEGIHFDEGRNVEVGQLLYTIDSQPFEAKLAETQSNLAQAKITLVKANNDLTRIQPLAEINAVSQSDLDAAVAEKGAAEAAVEAAQAGVRMAEIELSYTRIESPINGLIGKTEAKVGEFVGREPNPVILNTVSRIDTMRVDFYITENDYLRFAKIALSDTNVNHKEIGPRQESNLKLVLGDGSLYEHRGSVDFVDRGVEESTGSILLQSSFPNPNRLIRPGQFAKVRAAVDEVDNATLVPQRCVSEFQGNFFVWGINDSNIVVQTPVQIRGSYQDYYIVNGGLNKETRILFEGIQNVRSGMTIQPFDTVFHSQYAE
jgi:membrane fusion protein (multidrug efflux system)